MSRAPRLLLLAVPVPWGCVTQSYQRLARVLAQLWSGLKLQQDTGYNSPVAGRGVQGRRKNWGGGEAEVASTSMLSKLGQTGRGRVCGSACLPTQKNQNI